MATTSQYIRQALTVYMDYSEISYDTASNASTVRVTMRLKDTSYTWYDLTGGSTLGYLKVDGVKYDFGNKNWDVRSSGNMILATKDFTVIHNSDGNKTVSITGFWDSSGLGSYTIDANLNTSLQLTYIPRADNFTASNVVAGNNISLAITPQGGATNYDISVTYTDTNQVDTYVLYSATSQSQSQSQSLIIPMAAWQTMTSRNPYSKNVVLSIKLTSKNGTTAMGYIRKSIIASIPYVAPILPNLILGTHVKETNTAIINVVGNTTTFLKSLSNISITPSTATYSWGAVLGNIEIIVVDPLGNIVLNSSANPSKFTPYLSGNYTVKLRIKDSRDNWSNQASLSINVINYNKPAITTFTADRADVNGILNPLGTSVKAVYNISATSVVSGTEKNSLKYRIYNLGSTPTYTNASGLTLNTSQILSTYNIAQSYTVILDITDNFGGYNSISRTISYAQIPATLGKIGISAGMIYNEADSIKGRALQVGDTAHFLKDVYFDSVVDGLYGGYNVMVDGLRTYTNANYNIRSYNFDEPLISEKVYTVTIKGNLGSGLDSWYLNVVDNGSYPMIVKVFSSDYIGNGVWKKTFVMPKFAGTPTVGYIYTALNGNIVSAPKSTSTIEWIKLERGTVSTGYLPTFNEVFNKSYSASTGGYIKYPDGVIHQWKTVTISSNNSWQTVSMGNWLVAMTSSMSQPYISFVNTPSNTIPISVVDYYIGNNVTSSSAGTIGFLTNGIESNTHYATLYIIGRWK